MCKEIRLQIKSLLKAGVVYFELVVSIFKVCVCVGVASICGDVVAKVIFGLEFG